MTGSNVIDCSIVVCLYNQEQTAGELYDRLTKVMTETSLGYELIFVDDASADSTLEVITKLADQDCHLKIVELRRSFGQTAALAAGFDNACGDIIVSMDGGLRHMPEEIPQFLSKLDEGYDVVSGRLQRHFEIPVIRKFSGRAADWLSGKITSLDIYNFGATFKACRKEVVSDLDLYGQMHRFIPSLICCTGIHIVQIPVKNTEFTNSRSNYGIFRIFSVLFDLFTLKLQLGYFTRPLYFFARAAFWSFIVSFALTAYILFDKIWYSVPVFKVHAMPALTAAVFALISFGLVSTGLIGELIIRVYFGAMSKKTYSVRKIHQKS